MGDAVGVRFELASVVPKGGEIQICISKGTECEGQRQGDRREGWKGGGSASFSGGCTGSNYLIKMLNRRFGLDYFGCGAVCQLPRSLVGSGGVVRASFCWSSTFSFALHLRGRD